MAFAVTHVILAIVFVDLYRDYIAKKKFSTWYVLLAGVAGLAPDADIIIAGIINLLTGMDLSFHRIFSHSFVFVLGFAAISVYFFLNKKKKIKIKKKKFTYEQIGLFFAVIAVGWFLHVALDCLFAADGFLTLIPGIPLPAQLCPHPFSNTFLLGLDALILLGWLIHEQWRGEIKDYI